MSDSEDGSDGLALVGSNVLIYAHDTADPRKHATAKQLLATLFRDSRLVLSVQSLNEFFSVITRPTRPGRLTGDEALAFLHDIAAISIVQPLTSKIAFKAMEAGTQHGFSFWDSLLWAAAKEAGATVLYTEDCQHGRDIEGVRIVNPFQAAP